VSELFAFISFGRESFFTPGKDPLISSLIGKSVSLLNCSGVDTKAKFDCLFRESTCASQHSY
jgi:hypothetical protein